ncbi:MAG: DUF2207 domain-containing protein [Acidimicrobiia bacterium]
MKRSKRLSRALVGAGLLALAVLVPATAIAAPNGTAGFLGGSEQITQFDVQLTIEPSGDLLVQETIDYDFGVLSRRGIFRDIPVRFDYPKKADTDRVYPLDVVSVRTSEGTPGQYTLEEFTQNGIGYDRIKIGDPDQTITGEHRYEITYRVQGALNGFDEHDELVWNAVGTQWPVIINDVTVELVAPAGITAINCAQGSFGSNLPCETASFDLDLASFAQTQLFPFQGLTITIGLPKGAVPEPEPILEERWTPGRAFALNGGTVGGAAVIGLVGFGAFFAAFGRKARDRRFKGGAVDQTFGAEGGADELTPVFAEKTETPVEFEPPDDLRPGQVGTLVDFKAHPLDVTATIVDLAVRKYLVIEEVETTSRWLKNDWKLTKLDKSDAKLLDYEKELLAGLFKSGDTVELGDLKQKFAARMAKVQKALSDDAKAQGWFTRDPNTAQLSTGCLGILVLLLGIGVTVALAMWTSLGLLGIPLVLLGLFWTFSARWAPARTAKGSALLRRTNGFRRFIEESEKERARFAERKNLFSEYLPYAVVFGATEKWAKAFAGLDGEPPDTSYWYRSNVPFQYVAFSHAMDGFATTTAGTLTSTPPSTSGSSGFSGGGGGSSGGGGGGGGGGSW